MKSAIERKPKLTIGLDLGDKSSAYCVLDDYGVIVGEHKVRTTPKALSECFSAITTSRIALETGTHSPWISRLLTSIGHEVIVAMHGMYDSSHRAARRMTASMPERWHAWHGLIRSSYRR